MAFFDDIGKKISQAGQTTVQKTKDAVDVARLNSAISDEEKKLNEAYAALGRLYVAKHADDAEEDFVAMIAAVKESEGKIADCKQQIKDIKGVSICEKCGGEIPLGNVFCGTCGTAVGPAAASAVEKVACTRCGAMVDKAMRFCISCGNPMASDAPTDAPAQTPTPQPTVEATVEPVAPADPAPQKTCAHCGGTLPEDAAFCVECGTPVSDRSIPSAPTCPNCGSALLDGALFCTVCGTKL